MGSHLLLERKLRKHGQAALATVVAVDRNDLLSQKESVPGGVGAPKSLCKMKLRVSPAGEDAFEVDAEAWMPGTKGAWEGMIVPVLFDPSDHTQIVVDQSDEAWKPADHENMAARRAARAAEQGADPERTAAVDRMRTAALADPEGFRKLMEEKGPAAFGLPGVPGAPPVVAAPTKDPIDQLAKLADLRDRGALTDAEFEAEKKKLLGE